MKSCGLGSPSKGRKPQQNFPLVFFVVVVVVVCFAFLSVLWFSSGKNKGSFLVYFWTLKG